MAKISVLFVCLGNICRSPTAHAIFQSLVDNKNLTSQIHVDSAGTGDWHLGHAPDSRSSATAMERGYDLSELRSRLVVAEDFIKFDYIIAMDSKNLADMRAMCPDDFQGTIKLLLDYSQSLEYDGISEVPDPYYGEEDGFPFVVDLVEDASRGLFEHVLVHLNH